MICTFTQAIQTATAELLTDSRTHVIGLGATYPNGLDGTMGDLATKFQSQVHDMPCSESAVTGMCVGMSINELRPILHHGRIEFALHAMDAILTQAAKWSYMFGGKYPCPLTLRIAMGRQWGNGPQHTFTQKGIFVVPGLKVVAPATPSMAYHLLAGAAQEPNPVIYLESRWLYKTKQTVKTENVPVFGQAQVLRHGSDVTIVAVADMVLEALRAAKLLAAIGISVKVIDAVSIYPVDSKFIAYQTKCTNTGYLFAVDAATPAYSFAHEIIAQVGSRNSYAITLPDYPCPTAPAMTAEYYPSAELIANRITDCMYRPELFQETKTFEELNLPPTDNFDAYMHI